MKGIITGWNPAKGFMFIESEAGKYFAHVKDFEEHHRYGIANGAPVAFTAALGQKLAAGQKPKVAWARLNRQPQERTA